MVERRRITRRQFRQHLYSPDIGILGFRFEGERFYSPNDTLALALFELILPYADEATRFAFPSSMDVKVSFIDWQPGSIEIVFELEMIGGGGVHQFFESYGKFRKCVVVFINHLRYHSPEIYSEACELLDALKRHRDTAISGRVR